MPAEITAERLTSLFRPRSVALVGASDKSAFSLLAYHNLVQFGFAERTYLVNRRGAQTHGGPTGARGRRPADLDALAAVVARVGDLAVALGDDLSHWRSTRCALTAPPSRPWMPW
jgi:acetate---CoA ligase (ADP-forming)